MTGIIQFIPRHVMEDVLPDVRAVSLWSLLELYLGILHLQRTRKRELAELHAITGVCIDYDVTGGGSPEGAHSRFDEQLLSIWHREAQAEQAYNDARFETEKLLKIIKKLEGV